MKILYGINGEGLGHLNRSNLIISELRKAGHEVVKACPLHLEQIDGFIPIKSIRLSFKNGEIYKQKVITDFLEFNFKTEIDIIRASGFNPDLVITDFEPVTARYARKYGLPLVSIDNQHRFSKIDFGLPYKYIAYNFFLSYLLKIFIGRVDKSIVTCFHPAVDACNVVCEDGAISNDSSTIVYLKDVYLDGFLNKSQDGDFHIFTNTKRKDRKNIKFYPLDREFFKERLRSCHSVVSNAGNQIIGECLHYNKAITCLPIRGQVEQEINSIYLEKFGFGVSSSVENFTLNTSLPNVHTENGLHQVMRELSEWIK